MRTIAVMNLKGGVAKTVTTITLAERLANIGKRVLLIDADPQANLTAFYGIDTEQTATLDCLFNGLVTYAEDLIADTRYDGISVVPASLGLADCDIAAITGADHIRAIKDLVENVSESQPLDFCLIDCPPGFTAASVAALYAADEVIIPTTIDINAVDGAMVILKQIEGAKCINHNIVPEVLLTMVGCSELDKQAAWAIRGIPGLPVLMTPIRRSQKVPEAMFARKTLKEYSPSCIALKTYDILLHELAVRNRWGVFGNGKN